MIAALFGVEIKKYFNVPTVNKFNTEAMPKEENTKSLSTKKKNKCLTCFIYLH